MKHLVLGSEGQIGKYVCDEIEANGDEVIRWDMVLQPDHDLRYDWGQGSHLSKAFADADFVHFLAYDVGGSTYLADKQNKYTYINNNIKIMDQVFGHLWASRKPFYFASSQMSNMTDSVYGQLKAVGESYTRALGGAVVRFWNVYGYESDPEKTHVITDFIKQGLDEGKITCRTNGQEQRHFTHAKDAAWMLYRIAKYFDEFKVKETEYKSYIDSSDSWDVVRQTNPGPNDFDNGWSSIETVAKTIGSELNVPVYFSTETDTNQTAKNMPSRRLWSLTRSQLSAVHDRHWITLEEGIADMVERIKQERA